MCGSLLFQLRNAKNIIIDQEPCLVTDEICEHQVSWEISIVAHIEHQYSDGSTEVKTYERPPIVQRRQLDHDSIQSIYTDVLKQDVPDHFQQTQQTTRDLEISQHCQII